ncbi:hypothetical protein K438DRAFT_1857728 [Mycena galopus ATCC 62051]|nr:hypothetical protein K438DRAFT_1857728 [Mycena galopus ATCC 62051]
MCSTGRHHRLCTRRQCCSCRAIADAALLPQPQPVAMASSSVTRALIPNFPDAHAFCPAPAVLQSAICTSAVALWSIPAHLLPHPS